MTRLRLRTLVSGVNRADLLQLAGDYAPPPGESAVPGLECAGIVIEDPTGRFSPGTPVAALLGSGGYGAEVQADPLLTLDASGIDPLQAGVLPEALGTAWWNLVMLGQAAPGETVLVTGANSGVGHLAIQLARELGLRPLAAVRGRRWASALEALGAAAVVDVTAPDAAEQLAAAAPDGVDLALELVGAALAPLVLPALATEGRWLVVGLLGGTEVELDLRAVLRRRIRITGSSLRSLPPATRREIMAGVEAGAWPAVRAGRILARIDASFPATEQQAAHDHLASGGLLGKVALRHDFPASAS